MCRESAFEDVRGPAALLGPFPVAILRELRRFGGEVAGRDEDAPAFLPRDGLDDLPRHVGDRDVPVRKLVAQRVAPVYRQADVVRSRVASGGPEGRLVAVGGRGRPETPLSGPR